MATSMDVAEDAGNITIFDLVKAQGNVADEICLKLVRCGSLLLVQAVVLCGNELKVCQLEKDYAREGANISRMNKFVGAMQSTEPDKGGKIKVEAKWQDGGSMKLTVWEVEPSKTWTHYREDLEPVVPLGPEVVATLSTALQKVRQQSLDLFAAQNKLSNLEFEYAKCKQLLDTRVKEKDQIMDELLSKFVSLLNAKKSEIIRLKTELGEGDDVDVDDQDTDASVGSDNDVEGGTDAEDEGMVKTEDRPKKKGKKVKHKEKHDAPLVRVGSGESSQAPQAMSEEGQRGTKQSMRKGAKGRGRSGRGANRGGMRGGVVVKSEQPIVKEEGGIKREAGTYMSASFQPPPGTIHMTMDDISSDVENEEETKGVHGAPRAQVFGRNDSDSEKDESAVSASASRQEQRKSPSPPEHAPVSAVPVSSETRRPRGFFDDTESSSGELQVSSCRGMGFSQPEVAQAESARSRTSPKMQDSQSLTYEDEDFEVKYEDLDIGPQIGAGQFSTVHVGRYFGDIVAIKKQTRNQKVLQNYLTRELGALNSMHHPNIIEFLGACNIQDPGKQTVSFTLYIVTEFAEGGDLLSLLLKKDTALSWNLRMRIMRDAAAGLEYMHSRGLIHRDIKSSNFLLDRSWRCKLSDFGFVRELSAQRMTICGTDQYMAPELMLDEDYGTAADVYSFGIVLLEMLARKQAGEESFTTRPVQSLFQMDVGKTRRHLPPDAPESMVNLAFQCVAYEPPDRPDTETVLAWIDDLLSQTPPGEVVDPPPPPRPSFHGGDADGRPPVTVSVPHLDASPVSSNQSTPRAGSPIPPSRSQQHTATNPAPPEEQMSEAGCRGGDERWGKAAGMQQEQGAPSAAGGPVSASEQAPAAEEGQEDLSMEGWLHKRRIHGFRNWKKKYVTLKDGDLRWFDKQGGDLRGELHLAGHTCTVKDPVHYKWVITDAQAHETREFAASSYAEMMAWVLALQTSIDRADAIVASAAASPHPPSSPVQSPVSSPEASATMVVFLASLGLETLAPGLVAKGYASMQALADARLTDQDMDDLGLDSPAARRIFRAAFEGGPLRVVVEGHVQLGDTVYYKLRSKYACCRSVTYMLYEDLKALHGDLARVWTDKAAMPPLPHKTDKAAMLFIKTTERGRLLPNKDSGLSDWLRAVAEGAMRKGPDALNVLLEALELQATIV